MHARTAPPVLLLLLLAVAALCCTLPLAAAKDYDRSCAISFSQDESDPSYGTYCRLFSISGSSGFFDCRCSGANTTQPVLRDVSFIDGSFQPGFMWFALALPSNVSAQYNYTLPDGQLRSASASVGANASRFDRVKRAPASITYQMRYEGELGPGESVDFVAGWLPCRSDNPVQAQAPQAPAKGSNAVTFSWSLPCLADGPLDQLTYDLYLQNDTSTHFDRIRTGIRGSDTSISSVPIERRCEAYTARLQGVSRLLNGSTGPECLEAYDDLKFYVRNGPADPGPPTVDESTIETKALEVVWKASADDGGCPLTYIVSLLDSQRTNISASQEGQGGNGWGGSPVSLQALF